MAQPMKNVGLTLTEGVNGKEASTTFDMALRTLFDFRTETLKVLPAISSGLILPTDQWQRENDDSHHVTGIENEPARYREPIRLGKQ